jgi:hypothetical protein
MNLLHRQLLVAILMIGTDLKVIAPATTEVLGPEVHRLATIFTNAKTDEKLFEVWVKSHAEASPHTVRATSVSAGSIAGPLLSNRGDAPTADPSARSSPCW